MKALTIHQPWASLIIAGAKLVEWRGWAYPRGIVGQRIAIHAGARPARAAEIAEILKRMAGGDPSFVSEIARPLLEQHHTAGNWPLSSVLGTAIIGAPLPALDWVRGHSPNFLGQSDRYHSKFAWPLTEIERLDPPVPARGAQGFWIWVSSESPCGSRPSQAELGKSAAR